jgi:hypothetical protein
MVVQRLHEKYQHLTWMKLSEIASYWAAKKHTRITQEGKTLNLYAPFNCNHFTLEVPGTFRNPTVIMGAEQIMLKSVASATALEKNTWVNVEDRTILCFDLPQGNCKVSVH